MEKLKQAVKEIAYYRHQAKFSKLHLSLIPFLSLASSLYGALLYIRQSLYRSGFFSKNRLPVPVISVGNLTWGGNGKTPMAEFIAKRLADYRISPLILTRAGFEVLFPGDYRGSKFFERTYLDPKMGSHVGSQKIGAAVLDDGGLC
ncbi:putative tetraacyldisaccharide 4'-kinase, mitochondrial isoform X3 [Gossypium australe]|uniref:tetraacyldisaccharide 4'-kinase n=1 Tax=Gossypium australe TaxID=47621 RepID=A0A5B6VEK2_9ROSI|nr:putative tetraacyldisaccharide 4'-kinase, mitochondrial isoform X3 [Gossypium australe]